MQGCRKVFLVCYGQPSEIQCTRGGEGLLSRNIWKSYALPGSRAGPHASIRNRDARTACRISHLSALGASSPKATLARQETSKDIHQLFVVPARRRNCLKLSSSKLPLSAIVFTPTMAFSQAQRESIQQIVAASVAAALSGNAPENVTEHQEDGSQAARKTSRRMSISR
eukprot:scpid104352/ scgid14775/ 